MTRDEIMQMDGDALIEQAQEYGMKIDNWDWDNSFPNWEGNTAAAIDLLESTGCEYNVGKTIFTHAIVNERYEGPPYLCIIWDKGDYEATGDTLALAATRAWLMRECAKP